MSNLFDPLKKRAFDIVAKTMGYDATWAPSTGSVNDALTARVLYNNPTEKQALSGIDYDPLNWKMEYRFGFFPGLKELVDLAESNEEVSIDGEGDFYVRSVKAKFDGKCYIAVLEPKNN